jgi:hypothetical protein
MIGKYHSLSVGILGRIKDFLKKVFNVQAYVTIFINDVVGKNIWYKENIHIAYRPMGYFEDLATKKYDVVCLVRMS